MRLGGGRLGRRSAGELEGRERPDEIRMDGAHVGLDLGQQRLLVLGLQDLSAPALDDGFHPTVKTAYSPSLFPFAASA